MAEIKTPEFDYEPSETPSSPIKSPGGVKNALNSQEIFKTEIALISLLFSKGNIMDKVNNIKNITIEKQSHTQYGGVKNLKQRSYKQEANSGGDTEFERYVMKQRRKEQMEMRDFGSTKKRRLDVQDHGVREVQSRSSTTITVKKYRCIICRMNNHHTDNCRRKCTKPSCKNLIHHTDTCPYHVTRHKKY